METGFSGTPKVSIIMSYFNHERYVEEAVESIKKQSYLNWELLIIDDTNGFGNLKGDAVWHIYTTETNDIGLSALRNYGAKKTDGKYLLFIDADDKLHPEFLYECVKALEEHPEFEFAYTDTQHFDGANSYWEQPEYNFVNLLNNNYICACSLICREAFEDVGGFDENNFNYWEDYEFWIAMGAKGYYGYHIPKKLYYYRIHQESGMQSKRNQILSHVYKAYITNKFPYIYPKEIIDRSKFLLSSYPEDFMKWKPIQQEEFLKSKGMME